MYVVPLPRFPTPSRIPPSQTIIRWSGFQTFESREILDPCNPVQFRSLRPSTPHQGRWLPFCFTLFHPSSILLPLSSLRSSLHSRPMSVPLCLPLCLSSSLSLPCTHNGTTYFRESYVIFRESYVIFRVRSTSLSEWKLKINEISTVNRLAPK